MSHGLVGQDELGGMVQPGESAVFMLARASDPAPVTEKFRGFGGKVLRTTLRAEQANKLAETLAGQRALAVR